MSKLTRRVAAALLAGALLVPAAWASSHREAPMIAEDPLADNTDVYAFTSPEAGRQDRVVLISNYIPLENKASGPNFWGFGTNVIYDIHIDNNGDAQEDITFRFRFDNIRNTGDTFLYNTGPVRNIDDSTLNVRQTAQVQLVRRGSRPLIAGQGIQVCPSFVGVSSMPAYATIRQQAVRSMRVGRDDMRVFLGARADQFYIDLGAVFDLLQLKPTAPINGTRDVNVHSIAIEVPKRWLTRNGKEPQDAKETNSIIGVWSTASRNQFRGTANRRDAGAFVQVSRLGSPLVNELVIPLKDKDKFNTSHPRGDAQFLKYVDDPEPARLFTALFGVKVPPPPRLDLRQVFLTGVPGLNQPANVRPAEMIRLNMAIPPAKEPNRLGVLGGDLAGYPNGRRPGDDSVDITLRAAAGVLVKEFDVAPNNTLSDGVDKPDQPFLETFPFLADPTPGR